MDEVLGVIGIKQSSGDLKALADLLLMAKPNNLVFAATDALLDCAYTLGAHGSISAVDAAVLARRCPRHKARKFGRRSTRSWRYSGERRRAK